MTESGHIIVIAGATATGKSDLAVALASEIGGEIINADSMQLYRGMDIGTAKLTMPERGGIPHHMIDILDVSEDATVASYQAGARSVADRLLAEGKSVVLVGGTGLYIKAFLDDLQFPDTDPQVRQRLLVESDLVGGDEMHLRLARLDPAAAAAIPKENVRRVVRALEVIEITGKPFTAHLPRQGEGRYPFARQFGLVMERRNLRERIDERVDRMWEKGLVDEVDLLIERGIRSGKTARAEIGYDQVIAYREGKLSEIQAREETKRATRAFARRQETWFSRDERITWIKESTMGARLAKIVSQIS
ncbi:MAG: tRNA (adenosine(37)-N6)-dimethylallyltransferase MiaA [Actinomycetota bacterium]